MALLLPSKLQAHPINNYKYLTIETQGNAYEIETKLQDFFTKLGFSVIPMDSFPNLSREQGELALIAKYDYEIVYNGKSNVTLTLTNTRGNTVFKTKQFGISVSAKGDIRKAMKKIFDQITALNYKFTPSATTTKSANASSDVVDVSSVEEQIKTKANKDPNSIEGIYNSFNDDGTKYRIGIINKGDKDSYVGIVLSSNQSSIKNGDILFSLNFFGDDQYVGEYKANNFFEGGRIIATKKEKGLELKIGKGGKQQTYIFVKDNL